MRRRVPLLAALLATVAAPAAAQLPDTDIYVAELGRSEHGLVLGPARALVGGPGYQNQPWFAPDGRTLLYTAERDGQTEIFRIDLETGGAERLTETAENEFSPTLLDDGRILAVRWAADMSDGHLWLYSAAGEPLRQAPGDVPRVGYYAAADDSTFAVFVNDSAQTFVVSNRRTGEITRIAERSAGSPPRRIPGQAAVSLFQPDSAGDWWITRLDLATREMRPIVRARADQTHYAWTPDGVLLMADGSTIYAFDPARDDDWRPLATFDAPELQQISRIAVSPAGDRIGIVAIASR